MVRDGHFLHNGREMQKNTQREVLFPSSHAGRSPFSQTNVFKPLYILPSSLFWNRRKGIRQQLLPIQKKFFLIINFKLCSLSLTDSLIKKIIISYVGLRKFQNCVSKLYQLIISNSVGEKYSISFTKKLLLLTFRFQFLN